MKRLILALLIALTFASPSVATPPSWAVRVFVRDEEKRARNPNTGKWETAKPMSIGSGVLVSKQHILTNNHVVKDRKNDGSYTDHYLKAAVLIIFPDWTCRKAVVIGVDEKFDLALLELESPSKKKPIELADGPVNIGDKLRLHGYDGGIYGEGIGTVAEFTSPTEDDPEDWFEMDNLQARSGDSGGPITTPARKDRKLMGLTWGAGKGQTAGIRIRRIKTFLTEKLTQPEEETDEEYKLK